jgi:hypothetical protein
MNTEEIRNREPPKAEEEKGVDQPNCVNTEGRKCLRRATNAQNAETG